MRYDKYIYSTFECLIKHKKRLSLFPTCLSDSDVTNLIMGEMVKSDGEDLEDIATIKSMIHGDYSDYSSNFPKKKVLMMFENIRELTLRISVYDGLYIISLSSLLSIIRSHRSLQQIRIIWGDSAYWYNSKIYPLYALSMEMKSKYQNAGFDIRLEKQGDVNDTWYDCVIERQEFYLRKD